MKRAVPWVLLVTGVLLLLSATAHAFFGWPTIRNELLALHVPADVARGVSIGWLYGSAAMLTFGVIVLTVWWWALTGKAVTGRVTAAISFLYLGFGTWALLYSSLNLHFIGFIVLGVLLGVVSYGLRDGA